MNHRIRKTLFIAATGGLLLAAAAIDGPADAAADSTGFNGVAAPLACVASGCARLGDPANPVGWAPPFTVDIASVLGGAPH
jgi:hypothetical protein